MNSLSLGADWSFEIEIIYLPIPILILIGCKNHALCQVFSKLTLTNVMWCDDKTATFVETIQHQLTKLMISKSESQGSSMFFACGNQWLQTIYPPYSEKLLFFPLSGVKWQFSFEFGYLSFSGKEYQGVDWLLWPFIVVDIIQNYLCNAFRFKAYNDISRDHLFISQFDLIVTCSS